MKSNDKGEQDLTMLLKLTNNTMIDSKIIAFDISGFEIVKKDKKMVFKVNETI